MTTSRRGTDEDLERYFGGGAFFGAPVKPTTPEEQTTGDDVGDAEPQEDAH